MKLIKYSSVGLKMLYAAILHYFVCFLITRVNISLFYREYLISALISFTLAYIMIYLIIWFYERKCIKN